MRLEWEAARDADVYDAWATITLVVSSLVLSVQEFRGADLSMLGLDYRVLADEPWRYLTTNLLHGGWLHLVMNVVWIVQLGTLVEALLGMSVYTIAVVLFAAVSTLAQWAVSGPCIGLSGIVYGLFGVLWALDRWHPACRGVMNKRTAEFFGAWFLLCIVISWMGVWKIGNAAHGAGFLFGALVGWMLAGTAGRRLRRFALLLGVLGLLAGAQLPGVRHVINRSDAYRWELFDRGVAAIEQGDHETAVGLYEELARRDPENWRVFNNLSIAYYHVGRAREGQEAERRARELEPDDSQ